MDTIIVILQRKNKQFEFLDGITNHIISGGLLVLESKATETNDENVPFLLSTYTIIDLKDIINYTIKRKTTNYGDK